MKTAVIKGRLHPIGDAVQPVEDGPMPVPSNELTKILDQVERIDAPRRQSQKNVASTVKNQPRPYAYD